MPEVMMRAPKTGAYQPLWMGLRGEVRDVVGRDTAILMLLRFFGHGNGDSFGGANK